MLLHFVGSTEYDVTSEQIEDRHSGEATLQFSYLPSITEERGRGGGSTLKAKEQIHSFKDIYICSIRRAKSVSFWHI